MTARLFRNSFFYLILIAFAVLYLLPIYLMVLTGLKPINQVNLRTMWDLPTGGCTWIVSFRVSNSWRPTWPTA